jgi:citrate synthase
MQDQFPHASLELVQRYEHELTRVQHLQAKVDLQHHNMAAITKRSADASEEHTLVMNQILARTAELQAQADELTDEHRRLDQLITQRREKVDSLAGEMANSRISFARHFVSRAMPAAARRRDLTSPPKSQRPRVTTASSFEDVEPGDVLGEFDAATRAFVDSLTAPTQEDFPEAERLASAIADSNPVAGKRAVGLLLSLAATSLQEQRNNADLAFARGELYPHEHDKMVRAVDDERRQMESIVLDVAAGQPQLERRLRDALPLPDAPAVAGVETVTTRSPTRDHDVASKVLQLSRPAVSSSLSATGEARTSSIGHAVPADIRHDAQAQAVRKQLRSELQRMREQLNREEDALMLTDAALRRQTLDDIDKKDFEEQQRKTALARAVVEPSTTSPIDLRHSHATLPTKPSTTPAPAPPSFRPASASRYSAAAVRLGVARPLPSRPARPSSARRALEAALVERAAGFEPVPGSNPPPARSHLEALLLADLPKSGKFVD